MWRRAFEERIHPATVTVFPFGFRPVEISSVAEFRDTRRQWRKHTGPADFVRQQPGDVQTDIPNDLRFNSQPILPREQPVLRIGFLQVRSVK